jgi:type I restriction enzyme S subunit
MQLLQHFKELTIRPKNTKELKGLIIRLALRGNLTENWRKENLQIRHASELLEDIQDEKALLIEKRKLRPKKVSEIEVTQDMKYAIPKSWAWYNFSEVAFFQEGPGIRKWQYRETGVKLLNVRNVVGDNLVLDNTTLHVEREEFEQKYEHFKVEEGDLLFASSGGSWGKSAWFINPGYDVMLNTSMVRMCFYSKSWYPDYLKTFVSSGFFVDQMSEQLVGIQPNFGSTHLSRIYIPIPPLEEQKEIVKVVEILFKEVEQLEQLTVDRIGLKEDFVTSALNQLTTNNANQEWPFLQDHFKNFFNETRNIKKLRETVLQLAVQGKLTADWRANNPDTEDASILLKHIQKEKAQLVKDKEIKKGRSSDTIITDNCDWVKPNNWVEIELQDLFKFIDYRGKTPVKSKSGKRLITAKNIRMGFIKNDPIEYVSELFYKNWMVRGFPEKGNILFVTEGHTMGFVTQINLDYEFALAQRTICFQPFYSMDLTFYYYAIMSQQFQQIIFDNQTGSAASGIKASKLKRIPIPLPPLEEQKVIVQKVNALMGLCDSLEQEVQESQEQIAQLMQSCLREVFEGEK